jgi:isopentenyl-diphosphate delta-isomerase
LIAAVQRCGERELGVPIEQPECVLPTFRYRAVATDGTVENEICPVFCATTESPIRPAADEVMDWRWVAWADLRTAAALAWPISPWAAAQIPLLEAAAGLGPQ